MKDAISTPFTSNIGSLQGDSISGPMFTCVLNEAMKEIQEEVEKEPIDVRDINQKYRDMLDSNLPEETEYADDCDFITEIKKKKDVQLQKCKLVLTKFNLKVNESKTEETVIERKTKREDEKWRDIIKLGSKIGDKEDIKRRKELANTAMKNNDNIWKKKWTASMRKRLQLYNSLIKSILLYNCGTWGLSKTDEDNRNSFHRKQLRQVIGIKWPHKISNRKLYRITEAQEISKTIAERRWKLLGHILRLNANTPARKSINAVLFRTTHQQEVSWKRQDNHCDDNKQRHQTHKREKQFISCYPSYIIGKPTKYSIESQKQKVVGKNRETGALFGLFQLIDKGFHSFMITRRKSNRREEIKFNNISY